eukprot:SAG11_NODE_17099_length_528_cov_1.794872_1_plen_134_part_10
MTDEGWNHVGGRRKESRSHKPQNQRDKRGGSASKKVNWQQLLKHTPTALPSRNRSVVVLVGMPGCGKSTFCAALDTVLQSLRAANGLPVEAPGPVRVSQDDMGGRKPCELLARAALKANHSVIIDRCNFDSSQR